LNIEGLSHLELRGILVLVGSSLSNVLVSLLTLNTSLDGLLLVFDAFLELDDSILSVFLLLLDVLHELVKNVLRLEFLFFGASVEGELSLKDALLGLEGDLLLGGADFGRDEIFLHAFEHVPVSRRDHHLFVDFGVGLLEGVLKLLLAGLHLVDGAFSLDLLLLESPDFLLNFLKVNFLLVDHFVSIIVLLLDLRELDGDFTDLLGVVLLGGGIVSGVEEGVSLNEGSRPVVNLELFSHDLLEVA